jgi:ABC-2 type transport system ATP-binding protein
MDAGRVVFRGTPADLAALGTDRDTGDAPLERGYTAALTQARAGSAGSRP